MRPTIRKNDFEDKAIRAGLTNYVKSRPLEISCCQCLLPLWSARKTSEVKRMAAATNIQAVMLGERLRRLRRLWNLQRKSENHPARRSPSTARNFAASRTSPSSRTDSPTVLSNRAGPNRITRPFDHTYVRLIVERSLYSTSEETRRMDLSRSQRLQQLSHQANVFLIDIVEFEVELSRLI